jgi:glycosyltransferase involved in cell wall biosynthesis
MRLAVCIPTYARTAVLTEALESVRRQDLPHCIEIVVIVFNDCHWQNISIGGHCWQSRSSTIAMNDKKRCGSLGEKRGEMVKMAMDQKCDWLAWLDDDDLWMPHYIRDASLYMDGACNMILQRQVFYHNITLWDYHTIQGGIPFLIRPEYANGIGFSRLDYGEDNDFRARALENAVVEYVDRPGYCVRAGAGVTHASRVTSTMQFVCEAEARRESGKEPSGHVIVKPAWRQDYHQHLLERFPEVF